MKPEPATDPSSVTAKILEFWFQPIHPVRLAIFQRAFAATFLAYMCERFAYAREWLTSYGFHLTSETKAWYHPHPFPLLPEYLILVFGVLQFQRKNVGLDPNPPAFLHFSVGGGP